MADKFAAPWHKASFDRFIHDRLPQLLASRVPLAGYRVTPADATESSAAPEGSAAAEGTSDIMIHIEIASGGQAVAVDYGPILAPDDSGVITLLDEPYIVVPTASNEELDKAEMRCIGEQLYEAVRARLGQAPADMAWDEGIARAFLPLDQWINGFLRETAQRLDTTNWHARHTHLRRILIPNRTRVIAPGQMGRVDPFETPEGPNIGRVFTIAVGAAIQGERLVIIDDRPEAALGPNAQMVPFLEHDDANRLLMGVNMMRQALVPDQPEPALVQTGNEPESAGPDLWCGRNLLTAFIAFGKGTVEDGLVLSESAARRLDYPYPAEIGDKIANRHGTKGVVSQVLPDDQMPHLPDGRAVEIVYSFAGLATRMNFGQEREALMGLIAQAEGKPAVVPPFHAPSAAELRQRLARAGLQETGMVRLLQSKAGPELEMESLAGYVYWYRLAHLARPKLRVVGAERAAEGPVDASLGLLARFVELSTGETIGDLEIKALIQAGTLANAREMMTTRALDGANGGANGGADGEPPYLRRPAARLAPAGIALRVENGQLAVRWEPPEDGLTLARPVRHPWLNDRMVDRVGELREGADDVVEPGIHKAYDALVDANRRLERWLEAQAPRGSTLAAQGGATATLPPQSAYLESLFKQVENRLAAYFDALLPQKALQVSQTQRYSARAVIAPGIGLRLDQVGLPEAVARVLLAGQEQDLEHTWVVVLRAPALTPAALVAFHPVIVDGPAIRLHPQVTSMLNADFDGDLVSVFLPLSEAAQREAGEKLSVAGHLRRDPALAAGLVSSHAAVWGLAWHSLKEPGRAEIADLLGVSPGQITAPLTQAALGGLAQALVEREGVEAALHEDEAALPRLEKLARIGYEAASSGASLSPFPDAGLELPPQPESDSPAEWEPYLEAVREQILALRDFANPVLGPQLLSAAVRPRSRWVLPLFLGPRMGQTIDEQPVPIRHNYIQGFTPDELTAWVAGARRGLARLAFQAEQILQPAAAGGADFTPITLLARARASKRPGIIFARAAASGEVDPLTDVESGVLVGV